MSHSSGARDRFDERQQLAGLHCVREALRARRRALHRLRLREGDPRPEFAELEALAAAAGVAVERAPSEELARAAGPGVAHQGAVLACGALPEVALAELAGAGDAPRTLVALDGVEDPQNLGAIARVAEAAGAAGLVLTQRRSAPLGPAVARASAGAIEWLPVARVVNLARALRELQEGSFWVFGADPEAGEDLFALEARVARGSRVVLLGAEGRGLREGVGRVVDHWVKIPMAGRVASLNVSTAAAVALFELARRDRAPA